MQFQLIKISTVFMLNPSLPILLGKLAKNGYVTSLVREMDDSANIAFIEPPDVIAGKGATRISYNFGRRTLSVEGAMPKEVLSTFKEVEVFLKEMGIKIEKALIPCELTAVASVELIPKFAGKTYDFTESLGYKLQLAEGGFVLSEGDPASNKWLSFKLNRVWSSDIKTKKGYPYRLKLLLREKKTKVFQLLDNLENVFETILKEV